MEVQEFKVGDEVIVTEEVRNSNDNHGVIPLIGLIGKVSSIDKSEFPIHVIFENRPYGSFNEHELRFSTPLDKLL